SRGTSRDSDMPRGLSRTVSRETFAHHHGRRPGTPVRRGHRSASGPVTRRIATPLPSPFRTSASPRPSSASPSGGHRSFPVAPPHPPPRRQKSHRPFRRGARPPPPAGAD